MSTYFINLAYIYICDICSAKRSRRSPYSYCFAISNKNTKNTHFTQIYHVLPPNGPLNFYASAYIPNLKMWDTSIILDEVSNSCQEEHLFYEFLDLVWFAKTERLQKCDWKWPSWPCCKIRQNARWRHDIVLIEYAYTFCLHTICRILYEHPLYIQCISNIYIHWIYI